MNLEQVVNVSLETEERQSVKKQIEQFRGATSNQDLRDTEAGIFEYINTLVQEAYDLGVEAESRN